jgi:hypothetical protein
MSIEYFSNEFGLRYSCNTIIIQGHPFFLYKTNFTKEKPMTSSNLPKIHLRNSVTECAQSLRKENVGKYHNYGIADCMASIAAGKVK